MTFREMRVFIQRKRATWSTNQAHIETPTTAS